VWTVPRLCELYPGICLTTEEKVQRNLIQGGRRVPVGMMKTWTYKKAGLGKHLLLNIKCLKWPPQALKNLAHAASSSYGLLGLSFTQVAAYKMQHVSSAAYTLCWYTKSLILSDRWRLGVLRFGDLGGQFCGLPCFIHWPGSDIWNRF